MKLIETLVMMKDCIKKLLSLSEDFLSHLQRGNLTGLEHFEEAREINFKFLKQCNDSIEDQLENINITSFSTSVQEKIKEAARHYQSIARSLRLIDDQIELHLQSNKADLQNQLLKIEKQSSQIKRFKSTWVAKPGERLDDQI